MSRKYFGTDGIRGTANTPPMTPEIAMRLGMAAGKYFRRGGTRRHSVVIGKDTRLSGYMIEPALVAGFTSVGMDVTLFGPLPTPGVAMMISDAFRLTASVRDSEAPSGSFTMISPAGRSHSSTWSRKPSRPQYALRPNPISRTIIRCTHWSRLSSPRRRTLRTRQVSEYVLHARNL